MPTVIIRSLPGRLGTLVVGVLVGAVVLTVWLSDGAPYGLRATAWGGLVVLAVWSLWWAPQVTLDDGALTVRNAWRTHTVTWDAVEGCRTRWALEVVTEDGRAIGAAAAQRPGGLAIAARRRTEMKVRTRAHRSDEEPTWDLQVHRVVRPEYLEPGDGVYRTGLDSEAAGDLIEAYMQRRAELVAVEARRARRRQRLEVGTAGSAVGTRWNRGPVVVGSALAVLLAATALT